MTPTSTFKLYFLTHNNRLRAHNKYSYRFFVALNILLRTFIGDTAALFDLIQVGTNWLLKRG